MRNEGSVTSAPHTAHVTNADTVWPVAALYGAVSAGAVALGAWLAAWIGGLDRPWAVTDWVAEHALWGTLLGALVALLVRLGGRLDPELRSPDRRRAASARLCTACVALLLVALAGALAGSRAGSWGRALPALVGGWSALAVTWAALGRGLAGRSRFRSFPHLDPARVAALIALLTLPLAAGVRHGPVIGTPDGLSSRGQSQASLMGRPTGRGAAPESVIDAWRVMLGR